MMLNLEFNHPKFALYKKEFLRESDNFAKGITKELKEKVAIHEANLEILFSKPFEKEMKDGCSLKDFVANVALEKLWKEISTPQAQIEFVELIKLEAAKENVVKLQTNDSYRRTTYLEKRIKELLEQAGLTKYIPTRVKEIMEAMD